MSDDCLFCKIASREVPAKIVHEDEHVVAFHDINPQAPTHVLLIPKRHARTLSDLAAQDDGQLALGRLLGAVATVADALELWPGDGFRTVINTGERAAQSVFHVHVHLLGGRMFGWPPG
jgi:histidine triad (HIT) family protein